MNKNNSNSCRYMLIVIACISDHYYCYYEKNVGESFYPGGSHLFLRWK